MLFFMPIPYSNDIREKVINAIKSGGKQKNVAKRFGISERTVRRYWKFYKENKNIQPKKPTQTKPRKVDYKEIEKFVLQNPNIMIKEINQRFNIKHAWNILQKLGFTRKKNIFFLQRKKSRTKK